MRERMRKEANASVIAAEAAAKDAGKSASAETQEERQAVQGFHCLTWLPEGEAPFQEDDLDQVFH